MPQADAAHQVTGKLPYQGGFSLLEILMAVLILAIAFVGLTAYSGTQRRALSRSGNLTEASQFAITAMEQAKVKYSDATNFSKDWGKAGASGSVTSVSSVKGKLTTYTVTTTASRLAGSSNLMRVKVDLAWGAHDFSVGLLAVQP